MSRPVFLAMTLMYAAGTCLSFGLLAMSTCHPDEPKKGSKTAYDHMLRALYRHTVPTVDAATLRRELQGPAGPVLLDARAPAEFAVSHLLGAQLVPLDSLATTQFAGLDRERPVVVYCSVGYRSERVGDRLQALGFKHVRNLYGGLFQWVNEGYPVVNAAGPTTDVHPYSVLWSMWVKRGRKVYK